MPLQQAERNYLERRLNRIINDRPEKITANTKVVMSFGAAGKGYEYMTALREAVMDSKGWEDPCSVYLDSQSTAHHVASYWTSAFNRDGADRFRNPLWQHLYQAAMIHSKAMVFIVTKAWLASPWCERELDWWKESKLPVIVLMFQDAASDARATKITNVVPDKRNIIRVARTSEPIINCDYVRQHELGALIARLNHYLA